MIEQQETTAAGPTFNRKERLHLEALEARREHLRGGGESRSGDPAYPPGEGYAIDWALAVLRGIEEPMELRIERLTDQLRRLGGKVGRIEAVLAEFDDDEVD